MDKAEQVKLYFHCGEDCSDGVILHDDHDFCCHGCKTLYTLLNDTGLISYYEIDEDSPGSTIKSVISNSTNPLSVVIRDHLVGPIKMVD
tara:strand:+ start:186 stop:452 length:267 start_codon:yes stop_codon:yes gene_type:complete